MPAGHVCTRLFHSTPSTLPEDRASCRPGVRSRLTSRQRQRLRCAAAAAAQSSAGDLAPLEAALKDADSAEGEARAVALARELQRAGPLRGFGAARQVPKRLYTLDELRLNRIDAAQLLSPTDNTLTRVQRSLQIALAALYAALYFGAHWELGQLGALTTLLLGVGVADQPSCIERLSLRGSDRGQVKLCTAGLAHAAKLSRVGAGGAYGAVALDAASRVLSPGYGARVARHEAGHLLIAYLVGLLPRRYTLSSLQALREGGLGRVPQGGTQFCDGAFQREVAAGRLSSASLDRFTCVALAGVAAEALEFGQAEGGLNDVRQLDALLKALQFTQKKADGEIRWAVLNVVSLLRRHAGAHGALAAAMAQGRPVGECFRAIEANLAAEELVPVEEASPAGGGEGA